MCVCVCVQQPRMQDSGGDINKHRPFRTTGSLSQTLGMICHPRNLCSALRIRLAHQHGGGVWGGASFVWDPLKKNKTKHKCLVGLLVESQKMAPSKTDTPYV